MVRMSDILRRMGGEGGEPPKKTVPPPPEPLEPAGFRKEVRPTPSPSLEQSEELYRNLIHFVSAEIFEKAKSGEFSIEARRIQENVEGIVGRIQEGDITFLYLATTISPPDYYLPAHTVNTSIFAAYLGASLGYTRENLLILAMGALLHDLGMVKVYTLTQKKGILTSEEKRAIEAHVQFNVDLLKGVKGLPEKCLLVTQNVHERRTGEGYPLGLTEKDLSEEAQIVALCDVYEALTHSRSYREKFSPYRALEEILKEKALFDPRILKLFLQRLTVYPVGCWIELSTGERGQVFMVNPELPLRPTVKILFDGQKRKLSASKVIDLSQHATLYVKRSVDEKELGER